MFVEYSRFVPKGGSDRVCLRGRVDVGETLGIRLVFFGRGRTLKVDTILKSLNSSDFKLPLTIIPVVALHAIF